MPEILSALEKAMDEEQESIKSYEELAVLLERNGLVDQSGAAMIILKDEARHYNTLRDIRDSMLRMQIRVAIDEAQKFRSESHAVDEAIRLLMEKKKEGN